MSGSAPTVLIVEDHELLAESLSFALRAEGFTVEVIPLISLDAIVDAARVLGPDLVLLDLDLGHIGSALPLVRPLSGLGADVLVVTGTTDEMRIAETLEAGAVGYVHKSRPFDELLGAVVEVANGRSPLHTSQRTELLLDLRRHRLERAEELEGFMRLTPREQAVLARLMEGGSAESIAKDEYITVATVRSHIRGILGKLGVNTQIGAVAAARRAGWSSEDVAEP